MVINEHIFSFIYGKALDDAMMQVYKNESGDKDTLAENDAIRDVVKIYAERLINGDSPDFYDTVSEILDQNDKSERRIKHLTFGKVQKLVNMTTKYLYIKYYDDPEMKHRFDKCDAPLDNIIRDFVFESYFIVQGRKRKRGENPPGFDKEFSWSALDGADGIKVYQSFQNAVDFIIQKKDLEISRLEFDYRYWEAAFI